jgi:hypothetical protein
LGVHDIMDLDFSGREDSESDEVCPKGAKYGMEVHEDARMMFSGLSPKVPKPEHAWIRRVLEGVGDAEERYAEVECMLPVDGCNVVLKGFIDLLAVYPDHVEVHDYKTDAAITERTEREYRLQLSVYAHAAMGFYGRPCECHLEYVSLGKTVTFDPKGIDYIARHVESRLKAIERNRTVGRRSLNTASEQKMSTYLFPLSVRQYLFGWARDFSIHPCCFFQTSMYPRWYRTASLRWRLLYSSRHVLLSPLSSISRVVPFRPSSWENLHIPRLISSRMTLTLERVDSGIEANTFIAFSDSTSGVGRGKGSIPMGS